MKTDYCFLDKNGVSIQDGSLLKTTVTLKTGEELRHRGRYSVNVYEDKEISFRVHFGLFKGQTLTWYLETEQLEKYRSSAMKGIGRLTSEKKANAYREFTHGLDIILTKQRASTSEIITEICSGCKHFSTLNSNEGTGCNFCNLHSKGVDAGDTCEMFTEKI